MQMTELFQIYIVFDTMIVGEMTARDYLLDSLNSDSGQMLCRNKCIHCFTSTTRVYMFKVPMLFAIKIAFRLHFSF